MLEIALSALWFAGASIPAHPPLAKEFEYQPGRYLTVLSRNNGWIIWKRESSMSTECVASKAAVGSLPLTFSQDGWVHGGVKIFVWLGSEGESWSLADSTDVPLISSEWRITGERFMQPFPDGRLFPNEGHILRAINGLSPFADDQQIEVILLSRLGRRTTGKFSLIGLGATREALRRCRGSQG